MTDAEKLEAVEKELRELIDEASQDCNFESYYLIALVGMLEIIDPEPERAPVVNKVKMNKPYDGPTFIELMHEELAEVYSAMLKQNKEFLEKSFPKEKF